MAEPLYDLWQLPIASLGNNSVGESRNALESIKVLQPANGLVERAFNSGDQIVRIGIRGGHAYEVLVDAGLDQLIAVFLIRQACSVSLDPDVLKAVAAR